MNLLHIDFHQLYRRHLCRHGHFGINILHLIAVAGIYIPIFALTDSLLSLCGIENRLPILVLLATPWFAIVAANVPLKVSVSTAAFVAVLLAIFAMLPALPIWMWILLIPAMHRFQQFSHRLYHMDKEMSEFQAEYPQGFRRFVLLLVYELPILLQYLMFGRNDWVFLQPDEHRTGQATPDSPTLSTPSTPPGSSD